MALNSGIYTEQILTNDDEVCIQHLSSILSAVNQTQLYSSDLISLVSPKVAHGHGIFISLCLKIEFNFSNGWLNRKHQGGSDLFLSSQTHKLMTATKFSEYLGTKDYKKAKNLKYFIHLRLANWPQSFS